MFVKWTEAIFAQVCVVCCSVLQCVYVCCSVLQCVAAWWHVREMD